MKTKDLAISSLGVVFIAICAQISINFALVPFSLQLFAISLISLTLSKKQTLMCVITYIIVGLLGLPVFSGFKGGVQMIFSPTFGFILGFVFYSFLLSSCSNFKSKLRLLLTLIFSYLIFYIIGLTILSLNLKFILNIPLNFNKILGSYWLIFVPTDMLSISFACLISPKLKPITK